MSYSIVYLATSNDLHPMKKFQFEGVRFGLFSALKLRGVIFMTMRQEGQIVHMRRMGNSYRQIADELGVPLSTVKSFCRRKGVAAETGISRCECCGVEIEQSEHHRTKRFCSDTCRTRWWSAHRHLLNSTSKVLLHCLHCGREFTDYASTGRKYCCHECYIKARFGGAGDE